MSITATQFIAKWQFSTLNERQSYQAHFADLCALVGAEVPTPATIDTYCFERGVAKTGSKHGWADVWKRGFFAIEYKAPERNLDAALKQLMTYALALENPPLLVVCDTQIIQIHTHFTNAPSEIHTIAIADLDQPANLEKLRWLFTDPDKFHPQRTIAQITEQAAAKFADLAQSLNQRGYAPQTVAHFLNQCLFCLFAEDADLLPGKLFERLLDKSRNAPEKLTARLEELFAAMRQGGDFALEDIYWFNGGLFKRIEVLALTRDEIKILWDAAQLDWSGIEPSIFGTLFERGLDPKKRAQLGAHYTDQQSIWRIINPVIVEPLAAEWEVAKQKITALQPKFALLKNKRNAQNDALKEGYATFIAYIERLKAFRVLDPACGSGNFLYLALRALKDLEHKANLEAEGLGLQRQISIECSPLNVCGIELNPYAAELARVTVWIGEIQWMLKNGYPIRKNPILQSLDHIENRDALLAESPSPQPSPHEWGEGGAQRRVRGEAPWPAVDAIVGNPPFLGDKKMRGELGDDYTEALRRVYAERVPGGADLVTYWFEKARAHIAAGQCQRAGLVSTNSIRGGANQTVLARICASASIFNAWSDEAWINDGAAVRVSLVCFASTNNVHSAPVRPEPVEGSARTVLLNGAPVATIHADLTSGDGLNLTLAKPLQANAGVAFIGTQKNGAFDIPGELARQWLTQPNPNGRPNSDVIRPWSNGMDITRRPSDTWIIDFGVAMSEQDAAMFELPFQYAEKHIKPVRTGKRHTRASELWWIHECARPGLRNALNSQSKFIGTPRVAKHRLFTWLDTSLLPDCQVVAIARSDDTTFGILHSRFHELWSLRMGTSLEDRPRYTPTTTFETFPFPVGWADAAHADAIFETPNGGQGLSTLPFFVAIAAAAKTLNQLRENWLNPDPWVDWLRTPAEEQAGYPLRPVAKSEHEAELKKRTLTNLYNARPAWLSNAHQVLDAAVAAAYGWTDYTPEMRDEEILRRLLALNLERAG